MLDYAPHILDALSTLKRNGDAYALPKGQEMRRRHSRALDAKLPASMPKLWLAWRDKPSEPSVAGRVVLNDAVRFLLTACAVLVAGFGARRVGEVTSLRTECIVEDPRKPGLCLITIYVEKTLRELDQVPVPALMMAVVKLLENITADTRAVTGSQWLFQVRRGTKPSHWTFVSFELCRSLNEFARSNGFLLDRGGVERRLTPHQLRRGFAIAYYHSFKAASLDALSRFLRHYDPEMTKIYVTEAMPGAIGRLRDQIGAKTAEARERVTDEQRAWLANAKTLLDDLKGRGGDYEAVRCEALVHRMLQIWCGEEKPIGKGVAAIKADLRNIVETVRSKVTLLKSGFNDPEAIREPLAKSLKSYAGRNFLEPVPGHPAHCKCRPEHDADLGAAECLKAKRELSRPHAGREEAERDVRPDYAFSGAYVCLSCAHCVAFSENEAVLDRTEARLEAGASSPATRGLGGAARATADRIKEARRVARLAAAEHAG